jgi:hypothetical protein
MPETGGANIEVAHHLNEGHAHGHAHSSRAHEILEIVEAVVLALVAVTTAWSGYQAARWEGRESQLYEQSTNLRVEAQGLELRSNQERLYNASTVVEWLKSEAHHESDLAALFERRMLPEFLPAFEAWKKTDPIHNPNAPAGPMMMPEYRNAKADDSLKLNHEASEFFERGTGARERADDYVRVTVMLATVLLLTAISQRFRTHGIRVALIVVSFLLLCIPLWRIFTLPRA